MKSLKPNSNLYLVWLAKKNTYCKLVGVYEELFDATNIGSIEAAKLDLDEILDLPYSLPAWSKHGYFLFINKVEANTECWLNP